MLKVVNDKVVGIEENKRFLNYCKICESLNDNSTDLLNDEVSLLVVMLFCKGLTIEEIQEEIDYVWKREEIIGYLKALSNNLKSTAESQKQSTVKKIG